MRLENEKSPITYAQIRERDKALGLEIYSNYQSLRITLRFLLKLDIIKKFVDRSDMYNYCYLRYEKELNENITRYDTII
jgi:hypothetical protein